MKHLNYLSRMIINEWQLNSKLNNALQHAQRADFALYLALLSPAVEESAEFLTPDAISETKVSDDLCNRFGVRPARSFAMEEGDIAVLSQHTKALQKGGMAGLKLAMSMNTAPLLQHDDKKRLSNDIVQALSLHSQRRLLQPELTKPQANPAAMYEILQQLHAGKAA